MSIPSPEATLSQEITDFVLSVLDFNNLETDNVSFEFVEEEVYRIVSQYGVSYDR